MKKVNITAVIITRNEEANIKECLASVKGFCDEMILIDNGSRDKTAEIARKAGARVVGEEGSFSKLRNRGLREARGKWIFYLDADERVSSALGKELMKRAKEEKSGAFAIPRRNFILGKELKHGWWPDYVKRFFRRTDLFGWDGVLHEEPKFKGRLVHLKNPLLHLKHDSLEAMVEKTNEWSAIEARLLAKAGHPPMNLARFISAMAREFSLRMVKEKAFLDGTVGIIYALYQVFSRFVTYAKLWEIQKQKK